MNLVCAIRLGEVWMLTSVQFPAYLYAFPCTTGAVVGAGTLPLKVCVCKSLVTMVSTMMHFRDNY